MDENTSVEFLSFKLQYSNVRRVMNSSQVPSMCDDIVIRHDYLVLPITLPRRHASAPKVCPRRMMNVASSILCINQSIFSGVSAERILFRRRLRLRLGRPLAIVHAPRIHLQIQAARHNASTSGQARTSAEWAVPARIELTCLMW